MFGIIKLLVTLLVLAVFVWFGANVELGRRTLFEHLQAIGRTRETRDLVEGTRESARPLVEGVRKRLGSEAAREEANEERPELTPRADAGAAATDEISNTDRRHLRKVLGGKASAR